MTAELTNTVVQVDLNNPVAIKPIVEVAEGDLVAVRSPSRTSSYSLPFFVLVVKRLTAHQFITNNGRRFQIKNGKEIGDARYSYAIVVGNDYAAAVMQKEMEINAEREMRLWLYRMGNDKDKLPVEAIRIMKSAYDKWAAKQGSAG